MIRGIKKLGNKNVTANSLWGTGKLKKKKKKERKTKPYSPNSNRNNHNSKPDTLHGLTKTVLSSRTLNIVSEDVSKSHLLPN